MGCLFLLIGLVDFLIRVIIFRVVGVELAESSIRLKTIRATAIGLVGILIKVIVIKVIVIDWKSRDKLI